MRANLQSNAPPAPVPAIDLRPQSELPFSSTLRLCFKGIGHRLFRSVLTLTVVVLAVAFFMFLLSEDAILRSLTDGLRLETTARQFSARALARLTATPSPGEISSDIATSNASRIEEYASVSGWQLDRVRALATACAKEQEYMNWFANLPPGKSAMLFGVRRDHDIFLILQDPAEMSSLSAKMDRDKSLRLPGGTDGLKAFVQSYGSFNKQRHEFVEAWRAAISALSTQQNALTLNTPLDSWITSASSRDLKSWHNIVSAAGFRFTWDDVLLLQEQVRNSASRREVLRVLSTPATRAKWQKVFRDSKPLPPDEQLLRLTDPRAAEVMGSDFPPAVLAQVRADARREASLRTLESALPIRSDRTSAGSIPPRQVFLLVISFIVCVVGITNAMLMAITERFREIATMKCLGATDRFILRLFMMEAAFQGFAGGAAGTLVGFVTALIRDTILYGSHVFTWWPGTTLLGLSVVSWVAGIVLAILASIYPTWVASRMVPMEAMRVE